MPKTSNGELVNHFNAVRLRVIGSGNLDLKFSSDSDTVTQDLLPLVMQAATNIQPTRLADFRQQRAALRISTNEINEYFNINRIIIFAKPVATGYPG